MARLVVNPGSPTAWEIELKPGANTIGRGFANDFKITDPSVSSSHCQITIDSGNATLKDLGSTNGTFVNRAPVTEIPLQAGQTIHLGGVELLFHSEAPAYIVAPAPDSVSPPALPPPAAPLVSVTRSATVTASQQCKSHPKTAARYFCAKCNLGFCELCVTSRNVGAAMHKFCRRCGTECTTLQVKVQSRDDADNFYRRLPAVLAYPARGSGLFVLIVCTIVISALDFISAGIFSIFLTMIFFGYLFSFMQNIIHSTAAGDEEMPGFPPFDGLYGCFFRLAGAALISFGAAFALFLVAFFNEESSAGSTFMIPALILGCVYFPMALLAVAMKDTPLAANPLIVVPAIFKVPIEYILTVLVLAGVMGLRASGAPLIHSIFPKELMTHSMPKLFAYLGARALWSFANVYLLAVNVRILGLLYLTKKRKLAWFEH